MRCCQCQLNKCSKMSSQFRLQYQIDPLRGTMEPLTKSMHCPCPSPSSLMTLSASTGPAWITETSSSGCSKLSEALKAQSSSVGHLLILNTLLTSDTASSADKQRFLGFASFVSGLGPHPFLPALLGVVSVESPLVMVMEELKHRDLLGYLWRCRQVQLLQTGRWRSNIPAYADSDRQTLK